jgi:hypothetical protein
MYSICSWDRVCCFLSLSLPYLLEVEILKVADLPYKEFNHPYFIGIILEM